MTELDATGIARALGASGVGPPVRLGGGLLNHVFRVPVDGGTAILKVAPPFVATRPEIPLDRGRLGFEVRALRAVRGDGRVRVPTVLAFDDALGAALLEDLGDRPHLGARPDPEGLRAIGAFIGRLHAETATWDGAAFDNHAIQVTRKAVQYDRARDALAALGSDPDLAAPIEALGERLLAPGRCLVMGDLWPPSILVGDGWFGLIDWEFAHFGQPAQDLGHLAAHLALGALDGGVPDPTPIFLAGVESVAPIDAQTARDSDLHAAAEVLTRLVGPFAAARPPEVTRSARDLAVGLITRGQGAIAGSAGT